MTNFDKKTHVIIMFTMRKIMTFRKKLSKPIWSLELAVMKLLLVLLVSGFYVLSTESKSLIQKIEIKTDPKYVNASVELTNNNNISFISIFINQTVIIDRQLKVSSV
jgi:hypothetical protein